MAVTIQSRSIHFTALNDEHLGPIRAASLRLVGKGLTAGDVFKINDASGTELYHFVAEAANVNHEFLVGCRTFRGLKVAAAGGGTWTLTAGLD